MQNNANLQTATFGGGCFWGVEAAFGQIAGVIDTAVGYCGGTVANPTYEQVCTGTTGHAEVVQVIFDPAVVTYEHLLDVFWAIHDPTTLNRQGPDIGTQYRSVIFTHDARQEAAARAAVAQLEARGTGPVVTRIEPAPEFYRAEEYHQRYLEKRGQSSCSF